MDESDGGVQVKETELKISKTVIIFAPDEDSGNDYAKPFKERGLGVEIIVGKVPPRIVAEIGDDGEQTGKNIITKDTEGVSLALAGHIADIVENHKKKGEIPIISIACNTLSLEDEFVSKTIALLSAENSPVGKGVRYRHGKDYLLFNPLTLLNQEFDDKTANDGPLILGTVVMMDKANNLSLKSPTEFEVDREFWDEIQELSQELIWRIKASGGSDISTAPAYGIPLIDCEVEDTKLVREKAGEVAVERGVFLLDKLAKKGEFDIAWVCTELPILQRMLEMKGYLKKLEGEEQDEKGRRYEFIKDLDVQVEDGNRVIFTFTNPADLVADEIVKELKIQEMLVANSNLGGSGGITKEIANLYQKNVNNAQEKKS